MGRRVAEPSPIPRRFLGGPSRKKGEPVPQLSWDSHCALGSDTVKSLMKSERSTSVLSSSAARMRNILCHLGRTAKQREMLGRRPTLASVCSSNSKPAEA